MTSTHHARTTIRRSPIRRNRVAALIVGVAIVAVLGHQALSRSSSTSSWSATVTSAIDAVRGGRGALGVADGAVPDGTTVFDDEVPGVARLDPDLLGALRRAAADATAAGLELDVDSGWRSPAYQQHLRREATARYGSEEEAARWVATPTTSAHVSGDAVDIGPADAAAWLSQHGPAYGLCRIYGNEPWHFELRPNAVDRGCPAVYADPTEDPRMGR